MDSKSDQYKERFAELMEGVLTHASQEEEVVFPAARLKLNLQEIGARMQIMKSSQISVSTDL